jgi:hypothetical protein
MMDFLKKAAHVLTAYFVGLLSMLWDILYTLPRNAIRSGDAVEIILLLVFYGVPLVALILKPIFFWIIVAVVILFLLIGESYIVFTVYRETKETEAESETKDRWEERWEESRSDAFFDGMSREEAKQEYHRLMKLYHPDNKDGSLVMTQKIRSEYDKYRAQHES